ncbi:hypothetical protein AQJ91_33390 [Streptomyces dysideae]|uniref:Protein kinase domain-containing protein n=1 Tax=Streptomyces dysideae TaxID=909626 RepID=A0A101UU87_9ACTN|nr:hypothetical protein AQJ91_33390 [Streptomyces dysideae]
MPRASDVFSLGSVLTYAVTGRLPFPGEGAGVHSVMFHIAYEEPDLDGLPDGLVDLVRQCLAKEPEQRPSVRELIDRTRHAVARAWLPGELLARLGRDAARLLDAEVHLAEWDPVPAVSVPPHATTFPDLRDFDAGDATGRSRDVLNLPEAGIRPPSVRRVEEPRPRRTWLRIAVPSMAQAVVRALFLVPSLLGLGGAYDEDDPLTGWWEGGGSLPDGRAYAEIALPGRPSLGSPDRQNQPRSPGCSCIGAPSYCHSRSTPTASLSPSTPGLPNAIAIPPITHHRTDSPHPVSDRLCVQVRR